jgi:hypothetical protein
MIFMRERVLFQDHQLRGRVDPDTSRRFWLEPCDLPMGYSLVIFLLKEENRRQMSDQGFSLAHGKLHLFFNTTERSIT